MQSYNVTSVSNSAAEDRDKRMRIYFIMMTIRVLCVASLFWARGWWILVAALGAVFLPYLAVLIANEPDNRAKNRVEKPEQEAIAAPAKTDKKPTIIVINEAIENPVCSRAECKNPAEFKIEWRNPKIHDESRTKTWLACAEHKDYLSEYLSARNFPVTVLSFGDE